MREGAGGWGVYWDACEIRILLGDVLGKEIMGLKRMRENI